MWGKVSFHRSRKPTITIPEDAHPYPPSSLSRPQSGDPYSKALPTLPPDSSDLAPDQPEPNPPRVTSSLYSRDTGTFDHFRQRSIGKVYQSYQEPGRLGPNQNTYHSGTRSVEISPPDSPITRVHSRGSSRISPIDDEPKHGGAMGRGAQMDDKFASQIPVLRKRLDSLQPDRAQPVKPSAKGNATRWDDFSGEPTRSNAGRVGQATPGDVSYEAHISAKPPASQGSSIFGWGKEQLNSRKKISDVRNRLLKSDDSTPFVPREPWKGQSGRAPMVNPIQEKPTGRFSPRIPLSRSSDRLRETSTPSPVPITPSTITTISAGDGSRNVPRMNVYDAPEERQALSSASAAFNRAPPRVDLSAPEPNFGLANLRVSNDDAEAEAEPTSRFSVTTYDPTEAGSLSGSPRASIDTASQSTENFSSIMSRSRPIPNMMPSSRKPVRKPTPSEVSDTKALPQCPPEMQAQDRVQILEAKRDDLIRRRANINTIIHELTQVIQPSSIAYDMAAREEVKKTVASLNTELAEIKREEHEIGVKLLRAWKRRDDEDVYGQNTSLWVKRVTS